MTTETEAQKKYPVVTALAESTGRTLATLTTIFIVLKLTGNIDWSWWLVFTPTMIRYGLVVFFLTVAALGVAALQSQKTSRVRV